MRNKCKGFTIVELVIVIAVVSVLAAVLIPTFTSVIRSANLSADVQAVRDMNVILVSESADSSAPDSLAAVEELLEKNGITDFTPKTRFYTFFWIEKENAIILADSGDRPVYPEEYLDEEFTSGWHALGGEESATFPEVTRDTIGEEAQTFTVSVTQTGCASVNIPFTMIRKTATEGESFSSEICLPENYQKGIPVPRYQIKKITVIMQDGEDGYQVVLRSAKAQETGKDAMFEPNESAMLYIPCVTGNIEINIEVWERCLVNVKGDNMGTLMVSLFRNDKHVWISEGMIDGLLDEGYMIVSAKGTQNGRSLGELYDKEGKRIFTDEVSLMDGDIEITVKTEPISYNVELVLNKPGSGVIHTEMLNVTYPNLGFTIDLDTLGLNITDILARGYTRGDVDLLESLRPTVEYDKETNTLMVSDVKCDLILTCLVQTGE